MPVFEWYCSLCENYHGGYEFSSLVEAAENCERKYKCEWESVREEDNPENEMTRRAYIELTTIDHQAEMAAILARGIEL
jgi:hypothetical protein